jgi:hypothetical protein
MTVILNKIKNGELSIDMRGDDKWGTKVKKLRSILKIAAPLKKEEPMYTFSKFYICKDGHWYESNSETIKSIPILKIRF